MHCIVCRETNVDLSHHKFPTNSVLRAKWLDAFNLSEDGITKNAVVCSLHFEKKCFRLNPGTIPTLNLQRRMLPSDDPLDQNKPAAAIVSYEDDGNEVIPSYQDDDPVIAMKSEVIEEVVAGSEPLPENVSLCEMDITKNAEMGALNNVYLPLHVKLEEYFNQYFSNDVCNRKNFSSTPSTSTKTRHVEHDYISKKPPRRLRRRHDLTVGGKMNRMKRRIYTTSLKIRRFRWRACNPAPVSEAKLNRSLMLDTRWGGV